MSIHTLSVLVENKPGVLARIAGCSIQKLDELLPHRWAAAQA